MKMAKTEKAPASWHRLRILLKLKNLLRTIASLVPVSAPVLEIHSQLEAAKVDDRITLLEATDVELQGKVASLESAQPNVSLQKSSWPVSVGDYVRRIVDILVVYDGAVDSPPQDGERFLAVAHGCFISPGTVLTCVEAVQLVNKVAEHKNGRVAIAAGIAWYECSLESIDQLSGIAIFDILGRDDARWAETRKEYLDAGLPEELIPEPLETTVNASVSPWMGQQIGFVHTGEATDVFANTISNSQFDIGTISHFRKPRRGTIKRFVTSVLPGRVCKPGFAVFAEDGTLLGVMAETAHYPSDAGRRAIVRTLLGHPRFTVFPKIRSVAGITK
jgi:hypothetical protein